MLEKFDISAMGFGSAEYLHAFIETKKLAFEDLAKYCADMDFNQIPIKKLISKEYAKECLKIINAEIAAKSVAEGNLEQGNTIYLTTADKENKMPYNN